MMKAITSSDCLISIAGATQRGYNPYTVTHSVNSLRIGQVIYKICYPDDDLKRAIEKIVKPQLIEFAFCVSKSDIFHCLLSFLRQNPDVIRLVRAYLSTVSSMIVQQPSPKDIKFGIGAHKCENLLKWCIQLSVETMTCQLVTMQ